MWRSGGNVKEDALVRIVRRWVVADGVMVLGEDCSVVWS